jgi:hypothetical protein
MRYYAKIRNGVCRGVTQTGGPLSGPEFVELASFDTSLIGQLYDNGVFSPLPVRQGITQRDFWRRFTAAERESLQNILSTGTQAQKNKLNAFRDYVQTGMNVELDDDYIVASVTLMQAAGIIAPGRAAQILA